MKLYDLQRTQAQSLIIRLIDTEDGQKGMFQYSGHVGSAIVHKIMGNLVRKAPDARLECEGELFFHSSYAPYHLVHNYAGTTPKEVLAFRETESYRECNGVTIPVSDMRLSSNRLQLVQSLPALVEETVKKKDLIAHDLQDKLRGEEFRYEATKHKFDDWPKAFVQEVIAQRKYYEIQRTWTKKRMRDDCTVAEYSLSVPLEDLLPEWGERW
jgi:hypothetical protein